MNPFKICLFAVLAAAATAAPQGGYGGGSSQPQRQRCEWKQEVEYTEDYFDDCKTAYQTKCNTLYRKKCTPYQDEICETYQKEKCDTKYEEKKECEDVYQRKCSGEWQTDSYGSKIWVELPGTCKQLVVDTKCREWKEPVQDCYQVPDKRCRLVSKQSCEEEPYEECEEVPQRQCVKKHRKTPHQVCNQYCNGRKVGRGNGCSGGLRDDDVHGGNGGYNAQSVAESFDNAFDTRTEDRIGTKEVGTRSEDVAGSGDDGAVEEVAKDDDAITFG